MVAAAISLNQSAQAAQRIWNNTGTNFNSTGSWTGGVVPSGSNVAAFTTVEGTQPNLSVSIGISGFYFIGSGSSGYDITSSSAAIKFTLTGIGATGSGGVADGSAAAIRSEITSGTNTIDAPLILGAAAAATQVFFQSAGGTLVVNSVLTNTNAITLDLKGTGIIQLNGSNTSLTAAVRINDAGTTLVIGNDSALGTGTFTMASSGTLQAGGGARTIANNIVLAGNTTISGSNSFLFNTGSFTSSGAASRSLTVSNTGGIELAGNVFLAATDVAGGLTINGTSAVLISGLITNNSGANLAASSLTYSGSNALTLTNTNTYTGNTTVSAGTLKLGAADVIPDGSGKGNVSVTGTLDLNTFSETINGLSGAGTVDTVAGGTPTLTVGNNNQTSTFSGVIKNTAGTLALTKTGSGALTLSGANTYSGGTILSAGTLNINNAGSGGTSSAIGTGTLAISGGTTITTPALEQSRYQLTITKTGSAISLSQGLRI
jgi:autotransporter-associated beta strand protein